MEGTGGKKRFSVLFLSMNQQILSFGDHDPNSNDRADIAQNGLGEWYLHIYDKEGNVKGFWPLPEDTMVCNGYYEKERDSWVPVKDFIWK